MNATLLGMLAETSIHPGSGQDAGFVDLPVAREAATDYPVIVGSSLKGALLDRAREKQADGSPAIPDYKTVFGEQNNAGQLLVGDARLLLLPVRSLQGSYKWVTCPHLLERFHRDRARAFGIQSSIASVQVGKGEYFGQGEALLFLEERQFTFSGELPTPIIEQLSLLMASMGNHLKQRLVILNDDDFAWFARYGLAVNARNRLAPETKTTSGGGLWYEETIPPDSLFYCLLAERERGRALQQVVSMLKSRPYLQVGGNETVGQGWFAIKQMVDDAAEAAGGTA